MNSCLKLLISGRIFLWLDLYSMTRKIYKQLFIKDSTELFTHDFNCIQACLLYRDNMLCLYINLINF